MISVICGERAVARPEDVELANSAMLTAKGKLFSGCKEKMVLTFTRNIRFVNVKEFSVNSRENYMDLSTDLLREL